MSPSKLKYLLIGILAVMLFFYQNCGQRKEAVNNNPLDDTVHKIDSDPEADNAILADLEKGLLADEFTASSLLREPPLSDNERDGLISRIRLCRLTQDENARIICISEFLDAFYEYLKTKRGWTVYYSDAEKCYIATRGTRSPSPANHLTQRFVSSCKVVQLSNHKPSGLNLNSCVTRLNERNTAVLFHRLGRAFQHLRALVTYSSAGSFPVDLLRMDVNAEPFTDACGEVRRGNRIPTPIVITN